jgi:hypothetical protein
MRPSAAAHAQIPITEFDPSQAEGAVLFTAAALLPKPHLFGEL